MRRYIAKFLLFGESVTQSVFVFSAFIIRFEKRGGYSYPTHYQML